jgi:hypothetical protein
MILGCGGGAGEGGGKKSQQSTTEIFQATVQSKHVPEGQALCGPDILWNSL